MFLVIGLNADPSNCAEVSREGFWGHKRDLGKIDCPDGVSPDIVADMAGVSSFMRSQRVT